MTHFPQVPEARIEVGLSGPTVPADIWHIGDPIRGKIGTAKIGTDNIWVDITEWVRSWSFRRGANRGNGIGLRYEAGTFTCEINNGDRSFDPTNLTGPYAAGGVTTLLPMVRVRLSAVWAGVAYQLWTGFADSWVPDYSQPTWSTTVLTATDAFKVFTGRKRVAVTPVGVGEDSGARTSRVLTSIGWPLEDRVIAVGKSVLQATALDGDGLAELQLTQDSEIGEFYMDGRGNAVFRHRQATLTETRSNTAQAVFGDGGYRLPFSYGFEGGVAEWRVTGAGIAASTAQAHSGLQSLLMTVVGTPTQAYTRPIVAIDVESARQYTATMWVYSPLGGTVGAAIDWFDTANSYLDTSFASVVAAAATWTQVSVTGAAPADGYAAFGPTLQGSPPAGTQLYLDDVTFTEAVTEIPYASTAIESDDSTLVNRVVAAIAGGTEQVAEDAASQAQFLIKEYSKTDLLLTTNAEALSWAQAVLGESKEPELRFAQVTFNVPTPVAAAATWPVLLGRELGDRITVIRRPPGGGAANQRDCWVRGIEMSSDGADWKTTLPLETTTRQHFFTIGHPTLGRVGSNAIAF